MVIGKGNNQIPTNGMLGTAAFIDTENLPISKPQKIAIELKADQATTYTKNEVDAIFVATSLSSKLFFYGGF